VAILFSFFTNVDFSSMLYSIYVFKKPCTVYCFHAKKVAHRRLMTEQFYQFHILHFYILILMTGLLFSVFLIWYKTLQILTPCKSKFIFFKFGIFLVSFLVSLQISIHSYRYVLKKPCLLFFMLKKGFTPSTNDWTIITILNVTFFYILTLCCSQWFWDGTE
jgi:hypothetical protein